MRAVLFALFMHQTFAAALPTGDWAFVRARLKRQGFAPKFIAALKPACADEDFAKVNELNVLLYLRQRDDHGPQATTDAAARVRDFVADHRATFRSAEGRYGVDPFAIASLLYIESRYGTNVGRYAVASVFCDLLQADRPDVIEHLRGVAGRYAPEVTSKIRREIAVRAKRKSKWATGELKALAKLYGRDPRALTELKGSFAGAIGWPQFLPSSYIAYARAAKTGGRPDLGRADDAIHSVAHYLKRHGWREARARSHLAALLKYNKSHDYARAILKLADQSRPARGLSGL